MPVSKTAHAYRKDDEIKQGIEHPVRGPGEIEWRDDLDPLDRNWDWLTPDPQEHGDGASLPAELQ